MTNTMWHDNMQLTDFAKQIGPVPPTLQDMQVQTCVEKHSFSSR